MHNLQDPKLAGPRVKRSEIVKQQEASDSTYKDIIKESMDRFKNLEDKFKELSRSNQMEIKKLVKEQKIARGETARLKLIAENKVKSTVGSLKSSIKQNSGVKKRGFVSVKKSQIEKLQFETVLECGGELGDHSNLINSPGHELKSFRPSEINENLQEEDEYE